MTRSIVQSLVTLFIVTITASADTAVIVPTVTKVRARPSLKARAVAVLHAGDVVRMLEHSAVGFAHVRTGSNIVGFVLVSAIKIRHEVPLPPAAPASSPSIWKRTLDALSKIGKRMLYPFSKIPRSAVILLVIVAAAFCSIAFLVITQAIKMIERRIPAPSRFNASMLLPGKWSTGTRWAVVALALMVTVSAVVIGRSLLAMTEAALWFLAAVITGGFLVGAVVRFRNRKSVQLSIVCFCVASMLFEALAITSIGTDQAIAEGLKRLPSAQRTIVYSADGQPITIPQSRMATFAEATDGPLPKAIEAIEDRRFESRLGCIDLIAVGRALAADADGSRQGASTLCLQVAKLLLGETRSRLPDKLLEVLMSFRLRRYSNAELMQLYLSLVNVVPQGTGMPCAAAELFGKRDLRTLSVGESALLAAMLQSPGRLAPMVHLSASTARRNLVLQKLLQQRRISADEYRQAIAQPILLVHYDRGLVKAAMDAG